MKKLAIISLVLILSLSVIGVGYAAWTDDINITGTTNTGNVAVSFVDTTSPLMPNTTCGTVDVVNDGDTIEWDLASNLVPNAVLTLNYQVQNDGTVPAKLTTAGASVVVKDADDNVVANGASITTDSLLTDVGDGTDVVIAVSGTSATYQIVVTLGTAAQLPSGGSVTVSMTITGGLS